MMVPSQALPTHAPAQCGAVSTLDMRPTVHQHPWPGGVETVADVQAKLQYLRARCAERQRPADAISRSHYSIAIIGETEARVGEKTAVAPQGMLSVFGNALITGTPRQ